MHDYCVIFYLGLLNCKIDEIPSVINIFRERWWVVGSGFGGEEFSRVMDVFREISCKKW